MRAEITGLYQYILESLCIYSPAVYNYCELLHPFFLKQATTHTFIHCRTRTVKVTLLVLLVLGYWVWLHLPLILSPVDFTVPWHISYLLSNVSSLFKAITSHEIYSILFSSPTTAGRFYLYCFKAWKIDCVLKTRF